MPEELEMQPRDLGADVSSVIGAVSAAVLETMFFEEAIAAPCDHAWLENAVSAQVRFQGSHCGEFLLNVSRAAAQSIASGFLVVDQDQLSEAQVGEVMLELTNILCGAVMSNLWPESSLSLEAPEIVNQHELSEAVHRCFALPEGTVSVALRVCSGKDCCC